MNGGANVDSVVCQDKRLLACRVVGDHGFLMIRFCRACFGAAVRSSTRTAATSGNMSRFSTVITCQRALCVPRAASCIVVCWWLIPHLLYLTGDPSFEVALPSSLGS